MMDPLVSMNTTKLSVMRVWLSLNPLLLGYEEISMKSKSRIVAYSLGIKATNPILVTNDEEW